jgi:putative ABC transport system substrate-binding protein
VNRRAFVAGLGAVLAAPLGVEAQQERKARRIGYLSNSPSESAADTAFFQGLRDLGYVESESVVIDRRYLAGSYELAGLIREFEGQGVEIIVAWAQLATEARKLTSKIPMVFISTPRPVAEGLVVSLARPGGNATGLTAEDEGENLPGKRLEILKEVVPPGSKIGVLRNPQGHSLASLEGLKQSARSLGLQLEISNVTSAAEIAPAIASLKRRNPAGLMLVGNGMFWAHRQQVVTLTNSMPAIFWNCDFVSVGGLMCYGVSLADLGRRAATYVDISKHVGRVNRDSTVIGERAA